MLKPSLQLRIGQQLTMTPQLQQAIRLLQLPSLDLQAHVRETLETNVMLEGEEEAETPDPAREREELPVRLDEKYAELDGISTPAELSETPEVEIADEAWGEQTSGPSERTYSGDSGDDDRSSDFSDQHGQTLQEQLIEQLELAKLSPVDLAIARVISDAITDDGYLNDSLEDVRLSLLPEIEATPADVERVLGIVQSLEPAGVAARNLGECIALQLKQLDPQTPARDVAIRVALEHLDLVAGQQLALLRRQLRCSESDLEMALALVRSCHPRPGAAVNPTQAQYVIPDVFVRRTDHGWTVEINQATVPRVRVNQSYANLISRAPDHAMLRTQLQEARWLMRSLEIRNDTLVKVARCIVQRQTSFFEIGEEAMEPLILKDVAEAVEMHESTISRVTTAKYMHTPRGVFEFRYFFSSHVEAADGTEMSSIAIRAKIKKLISQENPENPLSDAKLAEILSQEGIPVARRTVAKYREGMQIAPSNERKRAAARAS
ncbi:MAG TPA: RNA polymerase factor sigma-54 [Steroidobacteraceae bacterium]|jgi:RNA polymerase sigma-54 factor|nr:RNA polymerase factor sigma-54 [Steroidobacteraceae bacterium]